MEPHLQIGDRVDVGDVVGSVGGREIQAQVSGVLRGLIHPAVPVCTGTKIGDVDPRAVVEHCFTISDKRWRWVVGWSKPSFPRKRSDTCWRSGAGRETERCPAHPARRSGFVYWSWWENIDAVPAGHELKADGWRVLGTATTRVAASETTRAPCPCAGMLPWVSMCFPMRWSGRASCSSMTGSIGTRHWALRLIRSRTSWIG